MYIKTLSLIAAVALCAACSSPDDPIDDTDSGQVESDAANDAGDLSPGTDDDASQPAPDAGMDAGDDDIVAAIGRYAQAMCDITCSSPFIFEWLYGGDVATCTTAVVAYAHWYDDDGAATTAADFDACAAALATFTCDGDLPDACNFTGSLAVGEACTDPHVCDSGLCDFAARGDTCGVCARPDAEGDPCRVRASEGGPSQSYCLGGLTCGSDDKCYFRAAIGESCGPAPCAAGAECMAGECVAQGVAGDACDRTDASVPQCYLGGGFICDETAGMCVAVEFQDVGDTCGTSYEDLFCRASVCIPDANSVDSTCKARGAEGSACDVPRNDCAAGLVCSEGICTPLSCDQ